MVDNNKLNRGQFFTITNPFTLDPFLEWFKSIPEEFKKTTFLEPFAGANNIPLMLSQLKLTSTDWACFDIEPPSVNNYSKCPVKQQDTIKIFPKGYKIIITNPPYLGKTSASTKHLTYPDTKYDDLYKLCLDKMLANADYVAAIIPETFIISNQSVKRLNTVISLTCKMFDDTKCPVCLALFSKENTTDFKIYRMNKFIGWHNVLIKYIPKPLFQYSWKINDPNGIIGIHCVDSNEGPTIKFCRGDLIDSKKIKISSRYETRVSGLPNNIDLDIFISNCNKILEEYRRNTEDVFLASFKNLRKDGKYRRRLDFKTAKSIMSKVVEQLENNLELKQYSLFDL